MTSSEQDRFDAESFLAPFKERRFQPRDVDALVVLMTEVRAEEREACARLCDTPETAWAKMRIRARSTP